MSTSLSRGATAVPRTGSTARRPPWLRRRLRPSARAAEVTSVLASLGLHSICESACCPNQAECFGAGTATFLIMGGRCTRQCRFCAVPQGPPEPLFGEEADAVAEACAQLGLVHVVVTSVTRDDLPDGGAGQFARTVAAVRQRCPEATVEVLVPDFGGSTAALETALAAGPAVLGHNIETVPRLYPDLRPQAAYRQSLDLLSNARRLAGQSSLLLKSGLMVGVGETPEEVAAALRDLRGAGCDLVTIGQYLSPSRSHLPVARVVLPSEHAAYAACARSLGFRGVQAGPFVRSSYHAGAMLAVARGRPGRW